MKRKDDEMVVKRQGYRGTLESNIFPFSLFNQTRVQTRAHSFRVTMLSRVLLYPARPLYFLSSAACPLSLYTRFVAKLWLFDALHRRTMPPPLPGVPNAPTNQPPSPR